MQLAPDAVRKQAIPLFLGKDASGEPLITDLSAMPHCLIAGTTGSGKSVCINTIIMSIIYQQRPDTVKLILIDPKVVESLIAERSRAADSPLSELTTREREVLAEVAQGKSNAAIASSLFLTKRAVEKHINSIFMKLDLREADDISRRVKAALIFLAEDRSPV